LTGAGREYYRRARLLEAALQDYDIGVFGQLYDLLTAAVTMMGARPGRNNEVHVLRQAAAVAAEPSNILARLNELNAKLAQLGFVPGVLDE